MSIKNFKVRKKAPIRISPHLRDRLEIGNRNLSEQDVVGLYSPPITLGNPANKVAMDSALSSVVPRMVGHLMQAGMCTVDAVPQFLGYAFLSNLTQNGLIRAGVETVADDMTRRWVEIKRGGESSTDDEDETIIRLTAAMERFGLRDIFNDAFKKIGYFGGCLVYIDVGDLDDQQLKEPLTLDPATFKKGSLVRFKVIEPVNIAPGLYNATDPLRDDYFVPDTWYVLGKEIHKSRFIYFTSGELPLLLKPAYNFFGIPVAQIALDYVAHFTGARESAARLLRKFSLTALKTNMTGVLTGGTSNDLDRRAQYFVQHHTNDGLMLIDKDTEDLVKLETPLSGVDVLLRQSLEWLAAIFRIPVVRYLGISPAGFNATGDADMRNYYDHVENTQNNQGVEPLQRALDILQLNEFGEIAPEIKASFVALADEDEKLQAEIQKIKADTAAIYTDRGITSKQEERARLATDPESGYDNIDIDAVPEPAGMETPYLDDIDKAGEVYG